MKRRVSRRVASAEHRARWSGMSNWATYTGPKPRFDRMDADCQSTAIDSAAFGGRLASIEDLNSEPHGFGTERRLEEHTPTRASTFLHVHTHAMSRLEMRPCPNATSRSPTLIDRPQNKIYSGCRRAPAVGDSTHSISISGSASELFGRSPRSPGAPAFPQQQQP